MCSRSFQLPLLKILLRGILVLFAGFFSMMGNVQPSQNAFSEHESRTGPVWQMGPCSAMPGPLGHKAPRFQSAAPSMKKKIQVCPMSEATQDIHFPNRKIQIHRYCPFLTKVIEVSLCGVQKRRKGVTKAIWPKPSLRR